MTRSRVILKKTAIVNDKFSPLRHHFQSDTPACHLEKVTADAFTESEERTPVAGTPQIPFEEIAKASTAALSLWVTYCDCALLSFSLYFFGYAVHSMYVRGSFFIFLFSLDSW
jgi:hypothetical protein